MGPTYAVAKFAKGQSGNPSGRPKANSELTDLARTHTAEAIRTLVAIMKSKKSPAAARVAAANAILDRGFGKPVQPNVHSGTVRTLADLLANPDGDGPAD